MFLQRLVVHFLHLRRIETTMTRRTTFTPFCPLGFEAVALVAMVLAALAMLPSIAAADETKPKKETILPVGVIQIALMTLNAHVAGYGMVEPAPASADGPAASVRVAAPMAGVVIAAPVFEGQRVEKGATLVQLFPQSGTSPVVVTAPIAGTVVHVNVRPGEAADPAKPLVEIIDTTRLVVTGTVPADDAAGLKLGRPVDISSNVANSKVTGTLLYFSPMVDPRTGGVTVRASLPADAGFRPGQFVKLAIATDTHSDILAVLVECLVRDPDIGYVVSFVEGNIATQKPVRVGVRDGDFVEIEGEGIKVGQTVVSSGAYALPKVTKVRIITPID